MKRRTGCLFLLMLGAFLATLGGDASARVSSNAKLTAATGSKTAAITPQDMAIAGQILEAVKQGEIKSASAVIQASREAEIDPRLVIRAAVINRDITIQEVRAGGVQVAGDLADNPNDPPTWKIVLWTLFEALQVFVEAMEALDALE